MRRKHRKENALSKVKTVAKSIAKRLEKGEIGTAEKSYLEATADNVAVQMLLPVMVLFETGKRNAGLTSLVYSSFYPEVLQSLEVFSAIPGRKTPQRLREIRNLLESFAKKGTINDKEELVLALRAYKDAVYMRLKQLANILPVSFTVSLECDEKLCSGMRGKLYIVPGATPVALKVESVWLVLFKAVTVNIDITSLKSKGEQSVATSLLLLLWSTKHIDSPLTRSVLTEIAKEIETKRHVLIAGERFMADPWSQLVATVIKQKRVLRWERPSSSNDLRGSYGTHSRSAEENGKEAVQVGPRLFR